MDIEKTLIAATKFRKAIEVIYPFLGSTFESFPRGTCGDVSLMLGRYLKEQGLGEFRYMVGTYGSEEKSNWSSHAWLQSGNFVVDITADQFPEILDPVIVLENSVWHQSLDGKTESVGDYRACERTIVDLGAIYSKIIDEINEN